MLTLKPDSDEGWFSLWPSLPDPVMDAGGKVKWPICLGWFVEGRAKIYEEQPSIVPLVLQMCKCYMESFDYGTLWTSICSAHKLVGVWSGWEADDQFLMAGTGWLLQFPLWRPQSAHPMLQLASRYTTDVQHYVRQLVVCLHVKSVLPWIIVIYGLSLALGPQAAKRKQLVEIQSIYHLGFWRMPIDKTVMIMIIYCSWPSATSTWSLIQHVPGTPSPSSMEDLLARLL